jgi:hypothetical protein
MDPNPNVRLVMWGIQMMPQTCWGHCLEKDVGWHSCSSSSEQEGGRSLALGA